MTNTIEAGTDALNQRVRAIWTSGDFGRIAKSYEQGAAEFIARLGLEPGEGVLDAACGTGNLALPAACAGASVTGIDISPGLLAQARARAAAEGQLIRFDEGDVEQMPYADGSFETVVTMFGAMFAAHPDRAAAELMRVTGSGGRIAMANWTPAGFVGEMFKTQVRYVPPVAGVPSPLEWGSEDLVRARFGAGVASLKFARRLITFEFPFGPAAVVSEFAHWYGPTVRALATLDAAQREAYQADLVELWAKNNRAADGTTRVQAEYLEVLAIVR
jgi:ubiquinone/menaquinone biosynthesis C-methylase UbiE